MVAFVKRLILTAVALPAVYLLSAVLTGYHHLAMAIVVAVVMGGGAAETGALLRGAGQAASRVLLPVLSATVPLVTYLEIAGVLPAEATLLWLALLEATILVHAIIAAERQPLAAGLPRIAALSAELLYPALLGSFIVRIAALDGASMRYVLFFCAVFGNDMSAYLAGRAVSPRTALGLKASPGKTGVGFATGLVVAVSVSVGFAAVFPQDFPYPLWLMGLVGFLMAMATFAGDLAESAIKRSAGVKDSGAIMLGRGGILDSVDSLVMTAPVYYLVFRILGS
jgi:phosphatidate cytidylyltransferase